MSQTLIAASVTPLREDGTRVDEDAIGPLAAFLRDGGADGVFCCGTTGEGVLLEPSERRRVAERFREATEGVLIVHCGAQSTAATAALAAHAAEIGADGAAVIPPPYFPLDDDALAEHMLAAGLACAPLPFYLYAFTARSGYPLPVAVVERVREELPSLAGLKVSESAFTDVEPYLDLGLPVFVGSEPLIPAALERGAAGSVSGLASAFPAQVAEVLHAPSPAGGERLATLRDSLGPHFVAALKVVLALRGVPVAGDMRAPLQPLPDDRRPALQTVLESAQAVAGSARIAEPNASE